jgi:hypothetical protein
VLINAEDLEELIDKTMEDVRPDPNRLTPYDLLKKENEKARLVERKQEIKEKFYKIMKDNGGSTRSERDSMAREFR